MTHGSKQLQNAKESVFELIEFRLDRNVNGQSISGRYGINVAKVREVVRMSKINPLTSRLSGLAGVFELRGVPIPVVHLAKFFGDEAATITSNQKIIVAEFGVKRAGFIVDTTHKIRRIGWSQVMPPASDAGSYITSMTLVEDNEFLFILDFEKIIADIDSESQSHRRVPAYLPDVKIQPNREARPATRPVRILRSGAAALGAEQSEGPLVLLVDDSPVILKNTMIGLQRSGFNVFTARNGLEAWDALQQLANAKPPARKLSAIVTDLEMPQMDGFILINKIRENELTKHLPVIIHSSLSGQATQETGVAMGANKYVVKNDVKNLVEALCEIIGWKSHVRLGA